MKTKHVSTLLLPLAVLVLSANPAGAKWWNSDWTIEKKITFDTTAKGIPITQPIGSAAMLIRLHDGNFQFAAAK